MYLFIFESIGTSELILIGLIALIIFGPRKLPEMMKMFGKAMADFKRSTNDFKESWEREVSFENLERQETKKIDVSENGIENSIERNSYLVENQIIAPEIKEVNQKKLEETLSNKNEEEFVMAEAVKNSESRGELNDKRDWL